VKLLISIFSDFEISFGVTALENPKIQQSAINKSAINKSAIRN